MESAKRITEPEDPTLVQPVRPIDSQATLVSSGLAEIIDPLSMAPPRGALINGTYRVQGPLGKGAMGVIVLAHDEQLERDVAIKLLRHDQAIAQELQAMILDEARAMARVHHPNVVEIYALGDYFGSTYFVMEYIEGTTLDEYAKSRGGPPLDLDESLSILDQICLGVSAIHAAGILHRDIKPSNILVGSPLRVAVADLGLAKRFSLGSSSQLTFCGTPAYVAPEVSLGLDVPSELLPRADTYSLGIVAYWLLTGRYPFEARSITELLRLHAFVAPAPPSQVNPNLPASFDRPILAALEKDPKKRTASPEDLRRALVAARAEAPMSQRLRGLRVLIADDSSEFRGFLSNILEATLPGAIIETVSDGGAALEAIKKDPPALAIFDIDMPVLDGIALTEAVRGLPEGGSFPIIVSTGTGGPAEWGRLSRLGASAFLVKPFDAIQLITLARGLLGVTADQGQQAGS